MSNTPTVTDYTHAGAMSDSKAAHELLEGASCVFCPQGAGELRLLANPEPRPYCVQCLRCGSAGPRSSTAAEAFSAWMGAMPAAQPRRESVNHPQHYGGDNPFEVIKVLEHWLTAEEFIGALKFNVFKYAARIGKKDDDDDDARKGAWYNRYLSDFLARGKQPTICARCGGTYPFHREPECPKSENNSRRA